MISWPPFSGFVANKEGRHTGFGCLPPNHRKRSNFRYSITSAASYSDIGTQASYSLAVTTPF